MIYMYVCAVLMRLKGMDSPFKVSNKIISSLLFGLFTIALGYGILYAVVGACLWGLGIVPGLPELGKLRENNREVWEHTAIRGCWNGALLSLLFGGAFWLVIAGASMPIWYKIGFILEDMWPSTFKQGTNFGGWALGEWLFGAALGLALIS